ncbi:hypothetical protein ASB57_18515 [Bordetella sp. N]|nr:hypothetical protein ASB57_18515 [Bordetella sp. N]
MSLGLLSSTPALHAGEAATSPAPAATNVTFAESRAIAQVVTGILGYARWPTPPRPELPVLCITGNSPYAAALLTGDEALATVRARRVAPGDEHIAQMCEALYVGELPAPVLAHLLHGVIGKPVVTLLESEYDPDCTAGAMFCLDAEGAQAGFLINLDIIARSGVRIHPNVLQLARRKPSP